MAWHDGFQEALAAAASDPAALQRLPTCYLGVRAGDMEKLADAAVVVEGVRLPVHSQVIEPPPLAPTAARCLPPSLLAPQPDGRRRGSPRPTIHVQVLAQKSGVLGGLFAEFLDGNSFGGADRQVAPPARLSARPPGPCPAPAQPECLTPLPGPPVPQNDMVLVLEEPFRGVKLKDGILFLCLCYRADEVSGSQDPAFLLDSLAPLLLLAHKLDAQTIQDLVTVTMAGEGGGGHRRGGRGRGQQPTAVYADLSVTAQCTRTAPAPACRSSWTGRQRLTPAGWRAGTCGASSPPPAGWPAPPTCRAPLLWAAWPRTSATSA